MAAGYVPSTRFLNIRAMEAKDVVAVCKFCKTSTLIKEARVMMTVPCKNPQCRGKYNIVNWTAVHEPDKLERWLDDAVNSGTCTSLSYDYEATGLDPFVNELCGTSFCRDDQPGVAIYVPVFHALGDLMEEKVFWEVARPYLSQFPLNAHNAVFEYKWTVIKGGFEPRIDCDTQIEAFLDDPNRVARHDPRTDALKGVLEEVYDLDVTELTDLIDLKTQNFSYLSVNQAYEYGCQDSDGSTRLRLRWRKKNMEEQPLVYRLEHDLIPCFAEMNMRGIPLDVRIIADAATTIDIEIDKLQRKVFSLMGFQVPLEENDPGYMTWMPPFDLGSKQLVAHQFYNVMRLPYDEMFVGKPNKRFPKGQPSVGKDALENLRDEFEVYDTYLKWNEAVHMRDNFITTLPSYVNPVTGYIHGSVKSCGAPTIRCSHSGPNMAQMPAKRD